jgi:hypothetical protein
LFSKALKLDASIYNLVENMTSESFITENLPDDLTISSTSPTTLANILGSAMAYDFSSLEKFYWAQPQSLEEKPYLTQIEKTRLGLWGGIRSTLTQTHYTLGTPNDDPCFFKTLKLEFGENEVTIPMKEFLALPNSPLIGNCLGYLVSIAAVDSSSISVQMTSR